MSEWNYNIVIKFLKAYEAEPVLWNPKQRGYKDKAVGFEAWNRLSSNLGIPVDDLKKKKETLMTIFRSHLKRKQKSMESGSVSDIYKPSWFAFDTMERFLGQIYWSDSQSNTTENGTQWQFGGDHNYSAEKATYTVPPLPVSSGQPQKGPLSEFQEANNLMEHSIATLNNVLTQRLNQKEEDETDLFGRLIAKRLKKFKKRERRETMYEIHKLILKKIHPTVISSAIESPSPSNISAEGQSETKPKKYKIIVLKKSPACRSLPLEIQIQEPNVSQDISSNCVGENSVGKKLESSETIVVSKRLIIPKKSDIIFKAFTKAADLPLLTN